MVTMVQERTLACTLGADDYLTKPIQWSRLKNILDRHRVRLSPGPAMVIENDPGTRDELRQLLEKEGWTVVEAEDRQTALECIAESPPHLILMNLQRPENGFGFIKELRKRPEWRSIPIIGVTDGDLAPAERDRLQGQLREIIQTDAEGSEEDLIAELRKIASDKAKRVPPVPH
jgi:DNA-binding response OmpR family regulator